MLENQIHWFKKNFFGSKSERYDPNQDNLEFDETVMGKLEPTPEQKTSSDEQADTIKNKRNRKTKDQQFFKSLPIVVKDEIIPQEVLDDPDSYEFIKDEYSDELDIKAATACYQRTIRKKYKKKDNRELPPVVAPAPAPSIPGTKITAELGAHIISARYLDHQPFYRLSQQFMRDLGIDIADHTIMVWAHKIADHLDPIAHIIHQNLLIEDTLQIDETSINYRKQQGGNKKGYLWIITSITSNQVYYHWSTNRSTESLKTLLDYDEPTQTLGFTGTIQCDGYAAYTSLSHSFEGIELGGCLAHIRRKFMDYKDQLKNVAIPVWLETLLHFIQCLYMIERGLQSVYPESRPPDWKIKAIRQCAAKPVCKKIKEILDTQLTEPKDQNPAHGALKYAHGQWSKFIRYLSEPHLGIDNNPVERAVRPTKIGAKNWLFIGSAEAGKKHATLYTLLENAKRAGINPRKYIITAIKGLNQGIDPQYLTPAYLSKAQKQEVSNNSAA